MLNHKYKILNHDEIKFIAIMAMLFNHIGLGLLVKGTLIYELAVAIGYFTISTMIYFLVEGYHYTHSKKRYALRLFIFALISQIPYYLVMTKDNNFFHCNLNVIFTLLLCFFLIWTVNNIQSKLVRCCTILEITIFSVFCDWPIYAPIFTLLFVWGQKNNKRLEAFFIAATLFAPIKYLSGIDFLTAESNLAITLLSCFFMFLPGICISYFYNGQRVQKHRQFSKWFFYVFYPAHLIVLSFIKTVSF